MSGTQRTPSRNAELADTLGSARSLATSADALVGLALAIVAAVFLLTFPRHLGAADEGLILYEAKRLLAGDVYFRDLFEMIPPGVQYLAAAAFGLFGTTVGTARVFDAAVQALITAGLYGCCRTAGVRRSIAIAAALLHPVVFWPVWPYVSPHWLSTLLTVGLLLVCLRRPWAVRPVGAAAAGVLIGCMGLTQHQRAVIFAAAVALLLGLDALCGLRFGERAGLRTIIARLVFCAAAALLVALPPLALLATRAGLDAVVDALIVFPLVSYHSAIRADWGQYWIQTARYADASCPPLLRWGPLALAAAATISAAAWWRRRDLRTVRTGLTAAVLGGAAAASTMYFPDLIHLGFIAPVSALAVAFALEVAVHALERSRPLAGRAALGTMVALMALLAWRAVAVRDMAWARIKGSAPTAFGRVDFDNADQMALVGAVSRRVAADPQRRLLCYPAYPALYLLTDTRNPTPFQIAMPGYNPDEQIAVTRRAIEEHWSPLLVFVPEIIMRGDPVRPVLEQYYEPVEGERWLWQARPATAPPAP